MRTARLVLCALSMSVMLGIMVASALHGPGAAAEQDELEELGLPEDEGREEVAVYCGACHSLKLVVQQGLSREAWDDLLDWMVEEQGMEELDAEDRALVLNYLSKYVSIEAALKKRKDRRR